MEILQNNSDKISASASSNPSAIDWLKNNPDKINYSILSSNIGIIKPNTALLKILEKL